jgi:WD40 repeat protein/DNA-binding winged helix-turn-helix (wHTH) protein
MENGKHLVYEFGGFQLDPARQILLCQGKPVSLAPKLFQTLVFLVEHRDRTLPKNELMQALWAETFVEEGNLSQNIFLLRKVLGDDRNGHSFIHTIPRRGYRFIAPVTETETEVITFTPGGPNAEFWKKNSPFRSLTVFEPEDAWLFFGRDPEIADLLDRLAHSPILAMVGNSGSGKSSLLRAGLIPALREGRSPRANGSSGTLPGESWRSAVVRPSAAPFDYLAEVLPGQLAPELSVKEQADFIADCREKLPAGGDALRNAVSALVFAATDKTDQAGRTRVLLVVDQFEELFTLTGKPEVRDRYIDGLLAAARLDSSIPVHLVLALRADFFGHCLDHPGLSRCLETSLFTLSSMTPEQMRETIEKRLELAGGRAEPGLIDSLLEDVGAEPGNLALLEHALGHLWEQCGGPGCTFTNYAYAQMGRLRGALGRHADHVYQSLENDKQRLLAQRIFLELVHLGEGAQDTRRRVAKAELLSLGKLDEVEGLLARLASSRLIAAGREGEETFVEVSHEALIREWPALREWLAENREELALERRLEQAAEEWQSLKRDAGALLQGARLAQAEEWLGRHQDDADLLREYVQASIEARAEALRQEREAQQRELSRQKITARRFRWFSCAVTILFVVAMGSAWFAYHQSVLEKSRAMAAQAEEMAPRDHGQALDLALRSWQTAKTEEAHLAMAKIIPEPMLTLKHDGLVDTAFFSPDGQRILSAAHDDTARLWSTSDGRLLAVLRHDAPVQDAEFSADGRRIVTASDDHTARIWDGTDGRQLAVLAGHTDKVWRAIFSADGQRVITSSLDRTARIWDSSDGRLLMTLEGHTDRIFDARFSPDGQRVLTASLDKTARVWDATSGTLVYVLQGHSGQVDYVQFSPDGRLIVTASYDGTARVWNSADGRLLRILKHGGPVALVAFSPDSQRIATASFDHTARIWNSRDGRLLATLHHDGPVQHVEFSRDGLRIATASFDHTARIWNSRDGRLLAILQGHSRELYQVAFSPTGEQIVTAGGDYTVRTWNLSSARVAAVLRHDSTLQSASFSSDGKMIATASDDHTARVWNASDGHLLAELKGHSDRVLRAFFSSDGQRIATVSWDGTAAIWSSQDGRLLAELQDPAAAVNEVFFSPDGTELVSISWNHAATLWNANNGRPRATLEHADRVWEARFSPDGQRIVTASSDHTARVWNAVDGHLLFILQGHSNAVLRAEFSADGRRIVTSSADGTARVWNTADGSLLATLEGHAAEVSMAVFSPDGEYIVTASTDKTARVWRAADGRLLAVLHGHTAEIRSALFSPGSQRVLTTGKDHTARLWDIDGRWMATLKHADEVWFAEFSRDGRKVVTASSDGTARVWDGADGRPLATLQGHSYLVFSARFSPDGRRILTGSYDQTARVWEILTLDDMERILSK